MGLKVAIRRQLVLWRQNLIATHFPRGSGDTPCPIKQ